MNAYAHRCISFCTYTHMHRYTCVCDVASFCSTHCLHTHSHNSHPIAWILEALRCKGARLAFFFARPRVEESSLLGSWRCAPEPGVRSCAKPGVLGCYGARARRESSLCVFPTRWSTLKFTFLRPTTGPH